MDERAWDREHAARPGRSIRAADRWLALTLAAVLAVGVRAHAPQAFRAPLAAAAVILVCGSLLVHAGRRRTRHGGQRPLPSPWRAATGDARTDEPPPSGPLPPAA